MIKLNFVVASARTLIMSSGWNSSALSDGTYQAQSRIQYLHIIVKSYTHKLMLKCDFPSAE